MPELRALILHGWQGSGPDHWQSWLAGRLTAAGGLDAILSVLQMPPGVPVAAVGLDNAKNAGHLAARIIAP